MPEQFRERSLLPVDVGFDLRNTGHSVRVYEGFSYRYLDQNNKKSYVYPEVDVGSTESLVAVAEFLAHAGYCVVPFTTPYGDVVVVPNALWHKKGEIVWNIRPQNGDQERWCQGGTLQEALTESGWDRVDLQPLSSDEY